MGMEEIVARYSDSDPQAPEAHGYHEVPDGAQRETAVDEDRIAQTLRQMEERLMKRRKQLLQSGLKKVTESETEIDPGFRPKTSWIFKLEDELQDYDNVQQQHYEM